MIFIATGMSHYIVNCITNVVLSLCSWSCYSAGDYSLVGDCGLFVHIYSWQLRHCKVR